MRITHRCESDRDVCDLMEASVAEFVCIDCLSQAPEVRTCYRTSTCDLKQETHVSQILSRAARISIQTPKYQCAHANQPGGETGGGGGRGSGCS